MKEYIQDSHLNSIREVIDFMDLRLNNKESKITKIDITSNIHKITQIQDRETYLSSTIETVIIMLEKISNDFSKNNEITKSFTTYKK